MMLLNPYRFASGAPPVAPGPTDGLILHYTMDSRSGATLLDETGTYTGTITGATVVPGQYGEALSFDGVNDKVETPGLAIAQNATFELTAFIRMQVDSDGYMIVFRAAGAPSPAATGFGFSFGELGVRLVGRTTAEGGFTTFASDAAYVPPATNAFLRIRQSPAGKYVYVDEGLILSSAVAEVSPLDKLVFGANPDGTSSFQPIPMLDEFRLYNRLLTTEEITQIRDVG